MRLSVSLLIQFGKQFANFIDDSPTLRRDLRRLKLGVRIKRWNGRSGAYCRSGAQTIAKILSSLWARWTRPS